jgi:hypothetical protein
VVDDILLLKSGIMQFQIKDEKGRVIIDSSKGKTQGIPFPGFNTVQELIQAAEMAAKFYNVHKSNIKYS